MEGRQTTGISRPLPRNGGHLFQKIIQTKSREISQGLIQMFFGVKVVMVLDIFLVVL